MHSSDFKKKIYTAFTIHIRTLNISPTLTCSCEYGFKVFLFEIFDQVKEVDEHEGNAEDQTYYLLNALA